MSSSLYLIDSSVWLEVLARGREAPKLRGRVDQLLEQDRAATTGMVRLEVLGGARSEGEYRRLAELFSALHQLPVEEGTWSEAAWLGFQLRRRGVTVPFTDLLIAAAAMHGGAVLLHQDRHFDVIAANAPLVVESHVPA